MMMMTCNGNDDSPLMARSSDDTLQASGRTSSALLPMSLSTKPQSCCRAKTASSVASKSTSPHERTLGQKYRTFLQMNQSSIGVIEHVMERFVFYGYLFKHDHTGIRTELYYAAWNIIRWVNDVVLEGWGEGMGITVGTRGDWISSASSHRREKERDSTILSEVIFRGVNSAVPILRAILTATTCIYPAMESWTRRSLRSRPSYGVTEQSRQYHEWEIGNCRAAQVSYRLERVRFAARLALLSISWWAQYRRRYSNGNDDGFHSNERRGILLLPLLRRGGELDPYEEVVPLQVAEEEVKVARYVGRRTGRRSIPSSPARSCTSPVVSNSSTFFKWLSGLFTSKNRIIYFYVVGELLHILRPLYWSRAENNQCQRRIFSINALQNQQRITASSAISSWKAWWISLFMDILSDKLLQVTDDGVSTSQHRLLGKGEGRHWHHHPPSIEHAQLEELERRRSRYMFYLLRSPMYNAVTYPLATFIGKMVAMIPSFGLARWASEYVLDIMTYWSNNRFMLES